MLFALRHPAKTSRMSSSPVMRPITKREVRRILTQEGAKRLLGIAVEEATTVAHRHSCIQTPPHAPRAQLEVG